MKSKKKAKVGKKKFPGRIVMKLQDSVHLPYQSEEKLRAYFLKNDLVSWKKLVKIFPGIEIRRLFTSLKHTQIANLVKKVKETNPDYKPPDFLTFCAIDCPYDINMGKLLSIVLKHSIVETAYVESDPIPPQCTITGTNPKISDQGYLNSSRQGVDAKYAWTVKGGCGEGQIQFIDIEPGWNLNHEDIRGARVNLLHRNANDSDFFSHGTAVLGVLVMQDNNCGGVGIAPRVSIKLVPQLNLEGRNSLNDAILEAVAILKFGDILLLEAQVTETAFPRKHWPVEIRSTTFDVIELATRRGIIVIEPAGNGSLVRSIGHNLNNFSDRTGKKVLDRTSPDFKDSGAIVVGAASSSVAHRRKRSSNYGNRVDCFAWGSNVFTTDDPLTAPDPAFPYIRNFNGTSSASAIVAGVAIAIQSIAEAFGRRRLDSKQMRDIMSNNSNGVSSTDAIGVMPDLKKIIDNVVPGLRS